MPVEYWTREEVEVYTQLLATAHAHIAHGSSTGIARDAILTDIEIVLGWKKPTPHDVLKKLQPQPQG